MFLRERDPLSVQITLDGFRKFQHQPKDLPGSEESALAWIAGQALKSVRLLALRIAQLKRCGCESRAVLFCYCCNILCELLEDL